MSSFNNFLNAIDGSYCTFAGGNDPNQDSPGDCGIAARANVISVSCSSPPTLMYPRTDRAAIDFYDEITLTPAYEIRQCNEYAKLGLLGTTVLFSSGDTGVAGSGNTCIDSNCE
jgi:tripeptidyl-peptidase-1